MAEYALGGAAHRWLAIVAGGDGRDLTPAEPDAGHVRCRLEAFARHGFVGGVRIDWAAAAQIDVETEAVADFVQQMAFENAQRRFQIRVLGQRRDRFRVAVEQRWRRLLRAQRLDQQLVQIKAREQPLAREPVVRNAFAAQHVHQLAAPAPGDRQLPERFDFGGASPPAANAAHHAAEAAEIAAEEVHDQAGLAERATVQDVGRLAFCGAWHGRYR